MSERERAGAQWALTALSDNTRCFACPTNHRVRLYGYYACLLPYVTHILHTPFQYSGEATLVPILCSNILALYRNGTAEGVPKSKIGVVGKELDEADGGCGRPFKLPWIARVNRRREIIKTMSANVRATWTLE